VPAAALLLLLRWGCCLRVQLAGGRCHWLLLSGPGLMFLQGAVLLQICSPGCLHNIAANKRKHQDAGDVCSWFVRYAVWKQQACVAAPACIAGAVTVDRTITVLLQGAVRLQRCSPECLHSREHDSTHNMQQEQRCRCFSKYRQMCHFASSVAPGAGR
jgi:hypothetical protein